MRSVPAFATAIRFGLFLEPLGALVDSAPRVSAGRGGAIGGGLLFRSIPWSCGHVSMCADTCVLTCVYGSCDTDVTSHQYCKVCITHSALCTNI